MAVGGSGGGGGGGSRAIKAGQAFVELALKDNALYRGLRAAKAAVQKFGTSLVSIGTKTAGIGASLLAPLMAAASYFTSAGDALDKMAARTGASVEGLSALGFAAEQSGASITDVEMAIKSMSEKLYMATTMGGEAADAFLQLGLNMYELKNMAPEAAFAAIADGLQKIEDPMRRSALANKILSQSGVNLLPLLKGGSQAIAEYVREAKELGIVMTTEQATAAAANADAMNRFWRQIKMAAFEIGGSLVPSLTNLLGMTKTYLKSGLDWIKNNQQLVVTIAAVAIGLVGAGTALTVFGFAVQGVAAGMGALFAGLALVKAGMLALVTLPGLVAVGFTVAVGALLVYTETGKAELADLATVGRESFETLKMGWGGFTAAIKKGDYSLSFKIGVKTMEVVWSKFAEYLTEKWVSVKMTIVDTWYDAMSEMRKMFYEFTAWVTRQWNGLVSQIGLEKFIGTGQTDAEVNAGRDLLNKEIDDARKKDSNSREEFRLGQLKRAMDATKKAREELAALVAQANAPAPVVPGAAPKPGDSTPITGALAPQLSNTRGAYTGDFSGQLAGGTMIDQKQLDQLQKINQGINLLITAVRQIAPTFG